MPYSDDSFDIVIMLDVFEHLSFEDQPKALIEIKRVLSSNGFVLLTIPNMTHLNSRMRFFFKGELDRTDSETNHPGERPLKENLRILKTAGFKIEVIKGITLTMPYIYRRIICRNPKRYKWLHDFLNKMAIPGIAMFNIFVCKNIK
jgi:ubiquinone/menaquinone biosynthesis C-methylase UbiE